MSSHVPAAPCDVYADERRRLVFARVKRTALFALVPIVLAAAANVLAFADHLPERLLTFAVEGGLCVATIGLGRLRAAERHAIALTLGFVLGMWSCLLWAISLSPGDLDVLVCPVASTMIAATLLFPWGVVPQTVASVYITAGYLVLLPWATLPAARITNLLISLLLGAVTSVVGAFIVDHQRRATFVERERVVTLAHERELLLNASRDLNGSVAFPELVERITRHGRRLVGSDSVALTLLEEQQQVFRKVAASCDVSIERVEFLDIDFPADRAGAFIDALLHGGALEIPNGGAFDYLLRFQAPYGLFRSLLVPIARAGRLLGLLNFGQRTVEPPFTPHQVRLAQGLAHQAAVALANARLIDELKTANRLKTEFVSTMSHELRTPLHVIIGYTEMLPDLAAEELAGARERIRRASTELLELIEATLDLGRIEAGQDAPKIGPVVLSDLWEELATEYAALPRAPAVALRWQPVDDLVVATDRRKLKIVVKNLVGNALKFTSRGEVVVACHREASACVLRVRDTGIGIESEHLPVIFEMFRQADSSDRRSYGGVGLGLYIVRRLTEQLGGTVEVESEPGRGATFTVRLPSARGDGTGPLRATA